MTRRLPLFATRISIKNFRGYAADFELSLPGHPCVVLLSGPNGLGKTSFFEAVEWALTGAVKRLDLLCGGTADPRDLVRRASGIDRFEVELDYRDEEREERVRRVQLAPVTGSPPEPVGTSISSIAEFLSSGESQWHVTEKNVADYLHLTHLHAQVAALRFVTFSAKERWVRVSPLAGADRFERVRLNLTNSKGAITRLGQSRSRDVSAAVERRQRWMDLLNRRAQMTTLEAILRDVLGPPEIVAAVAKLRTGLGFEAEARTPDDRDVAGAGEVLRALRGALEHERSEQLRRGESLGRLRAAPRQWAHARSELKRLEPRIGALKEELARALAEIEELARRAHQRGAALQQAQLQREKAATRHELLIGALRDREDLVRLEREIVDANSQVEAAEKLREAAEIELRKRREDLAARERLVAALDEARQRLAAVEQALKTLGEIDPLQKQLVLEEARSAAATDALRHAGQAVSALADAIQGKNLAAIAAERSIDRQRQNAASVQRALSVIAQHVSDDDTSCPVCRTAFGPGELRALAQAAIKTLDPSLAAAEQVFASIGREIDDLRRRELVLAQELRKAEADARAAGDTVAELKRRIQRLASNPLIAGATPEDATLRLRRAHEEHKAEVQRISRELDGQLSAEDLRQSLMTGAGMVEESRRSHALVHERRKARETRIAEVRARIEELKSQEPALAAGEQALRLAAQAAALEASNAREGTDADSVAAEESRLAEATGRLGLTTTHEQLLQLAAQYTASESTVKSLEAQWTAIGLPNPISEAVLDAESDQMGQRHRAIESALASVTALSASLERWTQAADVQALEADIRKEAGDADIDAHTRDLDEWVRRAQAALANAERARIAADELSETLQRVTSDFGDRALKPFGDLFRRYLRALVHDERFHGIEVIYQPAARSAALRFLVGLGGTLEETEAEYILSEGQLGGVSLAAMLAASTAFPWSRWKALLLDDPTQYNDLIHATALFDVLRNLVRVERYQVFVSTHDSEQASFLRRKLDGVGVDWIDCRYLAHGPDGIAVDVTRRS